jgi:hypothetical protein
VQQDGAADAAVPWFRREIGRHALASTVRRNTQRSQSQALAFDGWWDGGISWHSSRPSKFAVWNAESITIRPAAGSNIKFRQSETDNFDDAYMTSHGGYMRLFNTFRIKGCGSSWR